MMNKNLGNKLTPPPHKESKKITINELRQVVRKIIKEEFDDNQKESQAINDGFKIKTIGLSKGDAINLIKSKKNIKTVVHQDNPKKQYVLCVTFIDSETGDYDGWGFTYDKNKNIVIDNAEYQTWGDEW